MALKFVEISFDNIKNEIENWLYETHNKSGIQFSLASPYGQILSIIESVHSLSMLYLKNTIDQFDLNNNNYSNERIVKNAALNAGHIPTRAISATGTLKLTLKTNADDIPGNKLTIYNRSKIKNVTNGLYYSINLGKDKITYNVQDFKNTIFFLNIIQGEWKTVNKTGNGTPLQTYNITESVGTDIENFNVEVIVNGKVYTIRKSLWDMLPDEEACVVRTGYNGGIDVIFGNGSFGKIPPIAATIEINYLKTNGDVGNIFRRTRNDWKIIDDIYDGYGSLVSLEDEFNIDIYNDINFGADRESVSFTRSLLPYTSNNFVLATADQFIYAIKRLGVFSYVNAYEKYETIFVVASPNINLFKNSSSDYFSVDINAFSLDNYETSKIYKYLRGGENIQLTKKIRVKSPELSYYIINVDVISYSDTLDSDIISQIRAAISDYFLNINKTDRIPKSDIISLLTTIEDIYSVDVDFVCKKDEDYHREYQTMYENMLLNYNEEEKENLTITDVLPEYDPYKSEGIDINLGDIIFERSELPIIRGGWIDRYERKYDDNIDSNSMYKAINVSIQNKIDSAKRGQKITY